MYVMKYSRVIPHPLREEEGAVIIFMIVGFLLFCILSAVVVDFARMELIARKLQIVADSAALGSTLQFDGSSGGWKRGKRGSFLALRQNPLYEGDTAITNPGQFGTILDVDNDPLEGGSPYRSTQYRIGNIEVLIERGFYGSSDGGKTYSFDTLEAKPSQETSVVPDIDGVPCPCKVWEVANATRVRLKLLDVNTTFGRTLPGAINLFPDITREAVSAFDSFSDREGLPPFP